MISHIVLVYSHMNRIGALYTVSLTQRLMWFCYTPPHNTHNDKSLSHAVLIGLPETYLKRRRERVIVFYREHYQSLSGIRHTHTHTH